MNELTSDLARQLLNYDKETGLFEWRERPQKLFKDLRSYRMWNTRFANKPALTANHNHGYKSGAIFGQMYLAHRLAWLISYGAWPVAMIDHVDHDRSNNALSNLRLADHQANSRNSKLFTTNTSGFTGVRWVKKDARWRAEIKVDNKPIHLGQFRSKAEAIAARKTAEINFGFHPNHGSCTEMDLGL